MRKVPSFIKDCEAFLADAPSPCFILDRRGRVLWANPGGERLFGEDSPTLTGRPLEEERKDEHDIADLDVVQGLGVL